MIRWCRLVTEQARWVLVFVLLVTGWALTRIVDVAALSEQRWNDVPRILIDPSIDSLLSDQDPGRLFYERVRDIHDRR